MRRGNDFLDGNYSCINLILGIDADRQIAGSKRFNYAVGKSDAVAVGSNTNFLTVYVNAFHIAGDTFYSQSLISGRVVAYKSADGFGTETYLFVLTDGKSHFVRYGSIEFIG